MAETNESLLKLAEQKFHNAAEKIAKELIANSHKQPKTNADRIRAMSDEDLEDFLLTEEWMCDTYISCSECPLRGEKGCISILEWLKQPAEVDHG